MSSSALTRGRTLANSVEIDVDTLNARVVNVNGVSLNTNQASAATVLTNSVESLGHTLNLGCNTNTTTVNIACAPGVQVLNLGCNNNPTTINVGQAGDTVNLGGDAVNIVNANISTTTDPRIILNQGGATGSGGGCGINVEENGVSDAGYIEVNGTRDAWVFKAPAGSAIALDQSVSTTASPTFVNVNATQVTTSTLVTSTGTEANNYLLQWNTSSSPAQAKWTNPSLMSVGTSGGDVSGSLGIMTVNTVGGKTAAAIATAVNNATQALSTSSSPTFATVNAALNGTALTCSIVPPLSGDVSSNGNNNTLTVSKVGGVTASSVATAVGYLNQSLKTTDSPTFVTVNANLNGNATTSTTCTTIPSLSGDVTSSANAVMVATVGGKTASAIASAIGYLNQGVKTTDSPTFASVGVGSNPAYLMDVRNTSNSSQIHVSGTGNDEGGYILGYGSNYLDLAGGAYCNGSNWIAKASAGSVLSMHDGMFTFYTTAASSGVGSTANLTTVMSVNSSGALNVGSNINATGVASFQAAPSADDGESSLVLYRKANKSSVSAGDYWYIGQAAGGMAAGILNIGTMGGSALYFDTGRNAFFGTNVNVGSNLLTTNLYASGTINGSRPYRYANSSFTLTAGDSGIAVWADVNVVVTLPTTNIPGFLVTVVAYKNTSCSIAAGGSSTITGYTSNQGGCTHWLNATGIGPYAADASVTLLGDPGSNWSIIASAGW